MADRTVAINGKAACPICGKLVPVEHDFTVEHKQPESSAMCYGSGVYAPPFLIIAQQRDSRFDLAPICNKCASELDAVDLTSRESLSK